MKRGAIWLVVMFLLATASISCNGGKDAEIARLKSELEAAKKAVAAKPADDRPKLWLDQNEDTRRPLDLLGYDYSFVLRWQHGELDGWVQVDLPEGPKKIPINTSASGPKRDAAEVSGDLVIALR